MFLLRTYVIAMIFCMMTAVAAFAEGPLVNMNVYNTDVKDVLSALASIGHVNMVTDESVTGKMTVQLNNVPFETALDIVAKTKGLSYQIVGDVIVIGTVDQMNKGFGAVHIFKLQYAKASEAVKLVSVALKDEKQTKAANEEKSSESKKKTSVDYDRTNSASDITKGKEETIKMEELGRLRVDEATNSLVFYGSLEESAQIRKILEEIDIPFQQVSLETQIVAISKDASKQLGVDWKWSSLPQVPTYTREQVTTKTPTGYVDNNGVPTTYDVQTNTWKVARPTDLIGTSGSAWPGTIKFGSLDGHPYEFYYQATLSALITNGKANILARPKVTTINGKEALIVIGKEIPVTTTTTNPNGTTQTSIDYKQVGIILRCTPRINADGNITSVIHTEVSTPTDVSNTSTSVKTYEISTRSADTEVRLKDGETMVIGGLIGKEESRSFNKVPGLGDIPILGALFRSVSNSKTENEVVIFLTARAVK